MSKIREVEVNTGCRGMLPSEYNVWTEERMNAMKAELQAKALGTTVKEMLKRAASNVEEPAPATTAVDSAYSETPLEDTASSLHIEPLIEVYQRELSEGVRMPVKAQLHKGGPETLVPCYTYNQLECMQTHMPNAGIKLIIRKLREELGESALPMVNTNAQQDVLIEWVLEVQCMLARAAGLEVSPQSFGAPREDNFGRVGLNHAERSAV